MISETEVDDSFPNGQLNLNRNDGGIMLSIRNNISAKVVSTDDSPIEMFYVALSF